MPTSVRPAAAISHVGASANSSEPAPGDQRAAGQDAPRPQRVGEHADRNLQHRVDVEVRRGQRAQHRAVDRERAGRARRRSPPARCGGRTTARSSRARCRTRRGGGERSAVGDGAALAIAPLYGPAVRVWYHDAIAATRARAPDPAVKYADLRDFIAQLEAPRRAEAHRRRGRPAARDDRDLRPRAEGGRSGAAVREAEGPRDAGARQPVRHAASASRWAWARTRSPRCARSAGCSRS